METFPALLALCAGNSPVPGEFPTQRPVTRSFDVFFDLRLNKRLSKHWWGWWFETLSRPLWRHRNACAYSWIPKDVQLLWNGSDKTMWWLMETPQIQLMFNLHCWFQLLWPHHISFNIALKDIPLLYLHHWNLRDTLPMTTELPRSTRMKGLPRMPV